MGISRVAVVYDDRLRPDTTGGHAFRALASLVEAVHFPPDRRDEIPAAGFDLYLSIDDDTEHALPDRLRPLAYWAIDTHRDFDARLHRAARADLAFAAQRDGAERLRAAGVASATWLPLACDPDVHRKVEVPKRFDVAFVGHAIPGPRAELLGLLADRYPDHFLGEAYGDALAEAYSAARVAFKGPANPSPRPGFRRRRAGTMLGPWNGSSMESEGARDDARPDCHLVSHPRRIRRHGDAADQDPAGAQGPGHRRRGRLPEAATPNRPGDGPRGL